MIIETKTGMANLDATTTVTTEIGIGATETVLRRQVGTGTARINLIAAAEAKIGDVFLAKRDQALLQTSVVDQGMSAAEKGGEEMKATHARGRVRRKC